MVIVITIFFVLNSNGKIPNTMYRIFFLGLFGLTACQHSPVPQDYPIEPVPFHRVVLEDAFWRPRLETNRRVTIPHNFDQMEVQGSLHNFRLAARADTGVHRGVYPFYDSDAYKNIEAAAYTLQTHPDDALLDRVTGLIGYIGQAQEGDGYLYTPRTNKAERLASWAGLNRWEKLEGSHELYCSGHLIEAAIAHHEATGKNDLFEIALKNANLVSNTFGTQGLKIPPGHQEVELALAKLYRKTHDARYLQTAKFFLDTRGQLGDRNKLWDFYAQDYLPIKQQAEPVGHAVRLVYMNMGMMDVAALAGDQDYEAASLRLWKNVTSKKMYLTGGIGSVGFGEGFSENYDLPNMTAYSETCSSIGNAFWNHRLFLKTGDARYADVMERILYNAFLSGIGLSGDTFFYDNPLASKGQHARSRWFVCACCPPNVARFLPQVPEFMYGIRGEDLYVNLFATSTADVIVNNHAFRLKQETEYPWKGHIRLKVLSGEGKATFRLRLPGWAGDQVLSGDLYRFVDRAKTPPSLMVNGKIQSIKVERGYAVIHRVWKAGDVITWNLPMHVRRITTDEKVVQNKDRIALQHGPVVFAAEGADFPDGRVHHLYLPDNHSLTFQYDPTILKGVGTIVGRAQAVSVASNKVKKSRSVAFKAIPYYAWSHRGRTEMAVWLSRTASLAAKVFAPPLPKQSQVFTSGGQHPETIRDEKTETHFDWTPSDGKLWVQYDFPNTEEVSQVEVFWKVPPKNWSVSAMYDGRWHRIWNPSEVWGLRIGWNKVILETARTKQIRLEVEPAGNQLPVLAEWKVY